MTRRAYDNSLRSELADATRVRILDAIAALFAEGADDVSTSAVAKRARVSEPTVYRHFPRRESLIEAAGEHISKSLGSPAFIRDVADLGAMALLIARYFGRNGTWMRAGIRNPALRELRRSGRKRREAKLRALIEPAVAHLEDDERDVAAGAMLALQRAETWDYLTTELGLADEAAGRAMAFAQEAMLERLTRLAKARVTKVIGDEVVARANALESEKK